MRLKGSTSRSAQKDCRQTTTSSALTKCTLQLHQRATILQSTATQTSNAASASQNCVVELVERNNKKDKSDLNAQHDKCEQ